MTQDLRNEVASKLQSDTTCMYVYLYIYIYIYLFSDIRSEWLNINQMLY